MITAEVEATEVQATAPFSTPPAQPDSAYADGAQLATALWQVTNRLERHPSEQIVQGSATSQEDVVVMASSM